MEDRLLEAGVSGFAVGLVLTVVALAVAGVIKLLKRAKTLVGETIEKQANRAKTYLPTTSSQSSVEHTPRWSETRNSNRQETSTTRQQAAFKSYRRSHDELHAPPTGHNSQKSKGADSKSLFYLDYNLTKVVQAHRGRTRDSIDLPLNDDDREKLINSLPDAQREKFQRTYRHLIESKSKPVHPEPSSEVEQSGGAVRQTDAGATATPPTREPEPGMRGTEVSQPKDAVGLSAQSEFDSARMCLDRPPYLQNYPKAVVLFTSAAGKGYAAAQLRMGQLLLEGQGVSQDFEMAYFWLNLATAQLVGGDRDQASEDRDKAAAHLSPEDVLRTQRACREWKPLKSASNSERLNTAGKTTESS